MVDAWDTSVLVAAGIIAFILACSIGANDVANNFGTSVGAKVLTIPQAIVIAGIFEFLGAFLMGSHVATTLTSGIIKPEEYSDDDAAQLFLGMFAAMIGASVMLIVATAFSLPVSASHSVVGSILGFTLVAIGLNGVRWDKVGMIAASWVLSPAISGTLAFCTFWLIRKFILRSSHSYKRALYFIPFCYFFTIALNVFFVMYAEEGEEGYWSPWWGILFLSIMTGILFGLISFFLSPLIEMWVQRKIAKRRQQEAEAQHIEDSKLAGALEDEDVLKESLSSDPLSFPHKEGEEDIHCEKQDDLVAKTQSQSSVSSASSSASSPVEVVSSSANIDMPTDFLSKLKRMWNQSGEAPESSETFDEETEELFAFLQILTAIFGSFAHGANDVANAIAPFATILMIYEKGSVSEEATVEWYVLLLGAAGIVVGLATFGYRVIRTIGSKLTKVTPSRGFNIQLNAAMTVIVGSRLGIPLSTSHCQVGAVVGVGLVDGGGAINWKMVLEIIAGWLVTLPVSGAVSALVYVLIYWAIGDQLELNGG